MSFVNTSTIYTEGQVFHQSQYQGSMYMEVSYTNPLIFDNTLTITNPVSPSIVSPTQSNYNINSSSFFMGNFDGYWVHKIYKGDVLLMAKQTLNQDLFIPVAYTRVESTTLECRDDCGRRDCPDVPEPTGVALIGIAAAITAFRKRKA
jgi:hypothetical protein